MPAVDASKAMTYLQAGRFSTVPSTRPLTLTLLDVEVSWDVSGWGAPQIIQIRPLGTETHGDLGIPYFKKHPCVLFFEWFECVMHLAICWFWWFWNPDESWNFVSHQHQCGLFGGSTLEWMALQMGDSTAGTQKISSLAPRKLNRTWVEASDD